MRFRVTHRKRYSYSRPVFLEPHLLRLHPRRDPFQRVDAFSLTFDPPPAGQSDLIDANGNHATQAWFEGLTERLEVSVAFEVETLLTNPYDFLLPPAEALRLPMRYEEDSAALMACRERPTDMDGVVRFAAGLAEDATGNAIDFLQRLNAACLERVVHEVRDEGPPHPAEETLAAGSGSCRDTAMLFIAACRAVGIAARFVSGYQQGDPDSTERDLHAWAEVYIPRGGWRGYDPTHGLLVADRHIALAAAPEPAGAMPLTGTFRGSGVSWEMGFELTVEGVE